jgi:catechol 2,3-dioxygenase-like lactoylglutathione lyase family enzyme
VHVFPPANEEVGADDRRLSRRELARGLAAALPLLVLPAELMRAHEAPKGILELRLLTQPLRAQRAFYTRVLGLPLLDEAPDRITIAAGATRLTFQQSDGGAARPFYHFAFNIPENKLAEAKAWISGRTRVLSKHGQEVFHFPTWNAHSFYFNDPAGNIVELIARHDLGNASAGPFSREEILYASEIGVVVDDVAAAVTGAGEQLGLALYRPGSPSFAPVGDEHRLLILIARDAIWLPTLDTHAQVFPTAAILAAGRAATLDLPGYPFKISLAA